MVETDGIDTSTTRTPTWECGSRKTDAARATHSCDLLIRHQPMKSLNSGQVDNLPSPFSRISIIWNHGRSIDDDFSASRHLLIHSRAQGSHFPEPGLGENLDI